MMILRQIFVDLFQIYSGIIFGFGTAYVALCIVSLHPLNSPILGGSVDSLTTNGELSATVPSRRSLLYPRSIYQHISDPHAGHSIPLDEDAPDSPISFHEHGGLFASKNVFPLIKSL